MKDSAGLVSDTARMNFRVDASLITLSIDGKTSKMVNSTQAITFTAKVENAIPMPDSLTWVTNIENGPTFRSEVNPTDSTATLVIDLSMMPSGFEQGTFYEMVAKTDDNIQTNKVRFGFFDDGPVIYFESPTNDTSVSINDSISYSLFAFGNNTDASNLTYTLTWVCNEGTPCPTDNSTEGKISWSTTGQKKLIVEITNADSERNPRPAHHPRKAGK